MKRLLTAAIAVSVLATASMANAQGPQRDNGHHDQGPQRNDDHRGADRHDDSSWERHATKRYKANRYQPPRGYQARQWHRGDKLPSSYRGKAYTVDYRHYGLSAPPRGYQYVRVNNDVVLTAVATGVVASVIYQLFQ